jgi:hypothetical protein
VFLFKACPKCLSGDLLIRHEGPVYMATCLQCGHQGKLRSVYAPPVKQAAPPEEAAAKRPAA